MQLNPPPLTIYMYVSFGNFKRIIGEFIKNNRILFWEIQNRILGNVLGIIGSGLVRDCFWWLLGMSKQIGLKSTEGGNQFF